VKIPFSIIIIMTRGYIGSDGPLAANGGHFKQMGTSFSVTVTNEDNFADMVNRIKDLHVHIEGAYPPH